MLRVAEYYSGTDTGRQRRANEDSLFARVPLFVVADGMGGAQAGEVASRTAVEVFRRGLGDGASSDPEGSLTTRALEANSQIHELSQMNADQAGMGTTLTALYVGEQEVSIAHVGDSRAYCLRAGKLQRLTDDHSLVDELLRQGKLTPEEAVEHPQRSIITRALGPEPTVEVDTCTLRALAGDVYLLCSDGLTTMLAEPKIGEILTQRPRLRDAGEALLAAANAAGGRDNITVILFRLEDVHAEHEGQSTVISAVRSDAEADTGVLLQAHDIDAEPYQRERSVAETSAGHQQPSSVARQPRLPGSERPRQIRHRRRLGFSLTVLVAFALLAAGAYLASQSIYFIATNKRGLVTIYSGLPYTLPGKLDLYTQYYVSGVPASSIPAGRRHTLLSHSLRSETNASELVRSLELGQVSG
jgi:PPM family protein phosphatase